MPESQHIAWKRTWRDEFLKWLCGIANAEGGFLEIDRADEQAIRDLRESGAIRRIGGRNAGRWEVLQ